MLISNVQNGDTLGVCADCVEPWAKEVVRVYREARKAARDALKASQAPEPAPEGDEAGEGPLEAPGGQEAPETEAQGNGTAAVTETPVPVDRG
jgi:hypothetical protein